MFADAVKKASHNVKENECAPAYTIIGILIFMGLVYLPEIGDYFLGYFCLHPLVLFV